MRREGKISHFGAGTNDFEGNDPNPEFKYKWNKWYVEKLLSMEEETGEKGIDFFLNANSYSLLNYTLLESGCLDKCHKQGVKVIIGGPYSSGILALGADPAHGGPVFYNYTQASEEILDKTRKIEAVCREFKVPLMAVSL